MLYFHSFLQVTTTIIMVNFECEIIEQIFSLKIVIKKNAFRIHFQQAATIMATIMAIIMDTITVTIMVMDMVTITKRNASREIKYSSYTITHDNTLSIRRKQFQNTSV